MLKAYRIVSFLFNAFLVFVLFSAFYTKITLYKTLSFDIGEVIAIILINYSLATSFYYILKTGKIYKRKEITINKNDALDSNFIDIEYFSFPLGKFISISNIIIGLGFTGISIFIIIKSQIEYQFI